MSRDISNSDDVIDSRDVIERIKELEDEREAAIEEAVETMGEEDNEEEVRQTAADNWDDTADGDALKALKALEEEASGSPDWRYGETLIRDSYFEDYAQELAEDIGAIDPKANWPTRCINWEQAAEELKQDYTAVEFDGVTYWIRS